jgi:hypothetical protein
MVTLDEAHPRIVPIVKLLGIMLRNQCWPATFHTIIAEDANDGAKRGWCDEPFRP